MRRVRVKTDASHNVASTVGIFHIGLVTDGKGRVILSIPCGIVDTITVVFFRAALLYKCRLVSILFEISPPVVG